GRGSRRARTASHGSAGASPSRNSNPETSMPATLETPNLIQHHGEDASNDIRRRLAKVEPHCIRTFTPSVAVLAKSAGSYHWTPEGRKLADFSSGVLVMNLGHNPTRWWRRVKDYLGLHNLKEADEFCEAV